MKTMNNYASQSANEYEALIPADLRAKYNHLSYGEMAEIPELFEYADTLLRLEREWFSHG